jgi:hypothetical protein
VDLNRVSMHLGPTFLPRFRVVCTLSSVYIAAVGACRKAGEMARDMAREMECTF